MTSSFYLSFDSGLTKKELGGKKRVERDLEIETKSEFLESIVALWVLRDDLQHDLKTMHDGTNDPRVATTRE